MDKRKRPKPLSLSHRSILKFLVTQKAWTTPDEVARRFKGRARDRDDQMWAYLQMSRLVKRGFLLRGKRGQYKIAAKGRVAVEKAA